MNLYRFIIHFPFGQDSITRVFRAASENEAWQMAGDAYPKANSLELVHIHRTIQ